MTIAEALELTALWALGLLKAYRWGVGLRARLVERRQRKAHERYEQERERQEALRDDQSGERGVRGVARRGLGVGLFWR